MTSEPPVDDSFLINQFYLDGSYIPYRFDRTNCGRITIFCVLSFQKSFLWKLKNLINCSFNLIVTNNDSVSTSLNVYSTKYELQRYR